MFGKKRFFELLLAFQEQSFEQQKELILKALADFQGSDLRRDDLSVIGFRV